jgi:UDP-2,3-diacylglucosamine pyrophosphatase LpxH
MTDTAWFESAYRRYSPTTQPPSASRPDLAPAPRRHRTIFISDTHLGTRGCKAEALADFLAANESRTLYLVGDIIDGWQLKRRWYWTPAQSRVVSEILRKVHGGTRVIFVPGNHDEFARDYCGLLFAGIEVKNELIHETGDGRRLLVLHGDQFDSVIACAKWLAHLGDWAYGAALAWNDRLAVLRRALGFPYWSFSAWAKHKVKNASQYISHFEEAVAAEAHRRGVDGVVCGHIHHAEIRTIGGIVYHNDGDWVESCSALVEDERGHMEILRWTTASRPRSAADARAGQARPVFAPA